MKVWLDGKLVEESEAKLSVFDHGILYGDGVFEGIRFYNRRIFRLEEHIERLFDSAKAIVLNRPWTKEEVCQFTIDTVRANGLDDGYVRLVITRGTGGLGLSPYLCEKPSMFIIASTIKLYPQEHYDNGLTLLTCATRRPTPAALMPQVKSLNYLNNVMAKVEAIQAGALEGVMLDAVALRELERMVTLPIDQVFDQGLHEFLDEVQLAFIRLGEEIAATYFDQANPIAIVQEQSQSQSTRQR